MLLALFGAQYTYYEKDVAQDTLAIEAMIRGDERAVLNAVNAINESLDKDDLNTIDQVLSGLPTRVNYIYTDSLLGHDSWRGRLNDCDLVRSKNLENGRSITVGWLFGDLDGNVDLQSSGISSIYQLTSGGGDIFLSGNVASVNLRWKKSFKRGNVQWCIAFFLLLSFLLIVRGFLSCSSKIFYVGVPVLYLAFCWLNKAWFTDVSIFHDNTIKVKTQN